MAMRREPPGRSVPAMSKQEMAMAMGREPLGRSEYETVDLAGIRDAALRREYLTSGAPGPCDSSAGVGAGKASNQRGAPSHEAWAAWKRSRLIQLEEARLIQLEESCDESPWVDMLTGRAAPVVDDLREGSTVAFFFLGGWYPGEVASLLADGKIEVVWDDANTKHHLWRSHVRMRPPPPARQKLSPSAETAPSSGAGVATAASTLPFNATLHRRQLPGCQVEISGLVSEEGLLLNGRWGIVHKYLETNERCVVGLDCGRVVSVEAKALILVRAHPLYALRV